jgi:hypothetical protein
MVSDGADLFGGQDLESECLKPGGSEKLAEIGLALLKFVSSHRGLTYASWVGVFRFL